jgi:hypothetical protein
MKKFIFSFFVVISFVFGASGLYGQALSSGSANLAKLGGTVNPKAQVTAGIQEKLPILYDILNQANLDEATAKMTGMEVLLYKGMLSDMNKGTSVRNAYNDNIHPFLQDFPNGEYLARKVEIVNEFHSIVFFN